MPKNVMVVDDSAVSRMMLKAIINSAKPDWCVVEAESAEDALQKSVATHVDFITLDVHMPGMDGLSVAPALKEQCANAKIAILSGKVQADVKARADELNLIFIPKPITEDKVIRFLEQ